VQVQVRQQRSKLLRQQHHHTGLVARIITLARSNNAAIFLSGATSLYVVGFDHCILKAGGAWLLVYADARHSSKDV